MVCAISDVFMQEDIPLLKAIVDIHQGLNYFRVEWYWWSRVVSDFCDL